MTNKIDTVLKAITDQIAGTLPSDTVKNPKLRTHLDSSAHSYPTIDPQCSTQIHSLINAIIIHPKQPEESQVNEPDMEQEEEDDGDVMFIEIIQDNDEPHNEGPNEGERATMEEPAVEYVDTFPTRDELTYHSSIIDPRLSQVVLRRPFVEISNMTHDPPKGVVRFIRWSDEVPYKMPHKIEQFDSFSDLEKEHTKSVYLRNEEDKRRGV
ncbi:hypothetical protein Tco_1445696, partial [Tanacetum coccineum]